ncbi:MAG: hypothetical protein M3Y60_04825 [Bacteroidota bacterium]|nr:hypothetical protein [Bacteroidota bacterium]
MKFSFYLFAQKMMSLLILLLIAASSEVVHAQVTSPGSADTLVGGFIDPPLEARPKGLWPWVNGNFSLPQITHELEEAKQKGMGGFDIWDVASTINPEGIMPDGPAFLSDESLQAIAHAVREAERIGMEIGLVSSSSWNAGGAWVKPEHGAMGLFRSDTIVQGPARFAAAIPFPHIPAKFGGRNMILHNDPGTGLPVFYREVAVLAHPVNADSSIVATSDIVDLSSHLRKGRISWRLPEGKWRIVRYICAPTGQPLMLPSPNSNGLMLDHFSSEAQEANIAYVLQRLKDGIGSLHHRSLKYIYEDSYEVNSAVWTPKLPQEFEARNGYSLTKYLPILDGFSIVSPEISNRFMFDFSKLLSDLIIENHYAKGRELTEKEGLGFYAEAGGPGQPIHNVPFEDLKALGSLTVPRGEFWNRHPQLDKLQIIKGIASASHIYDQKYVEAESFTSVRLWQEGPGELKPLADRAMCEGLNRFVYHTFPHTPPESGNPGWVYNFGTLINTTNGWWDKSAPFHEYLARCSYLLQQGNFVGDVAFYYGDRAPNFVAPKHIPEGLGFGYDYDVVNSDVILNKMQVRDGKITLPHGQTYEVLVLPEEESVDLDVLNKIKALVAAGATVIGPKPSRSYGLNNFDDDDRTIKSIASELWGNIDGSTVKENNHGKGTVISGTAVRDVLRAKSVIPDVQLNGSDGNSIDFIHRRTADAEIYFIWNRGKDKITGTCTFRVTGKQPEWWDPETGAITPIHHYEAQEKATTIPLPLPSQGSCFIVFRDRKSGLPQPIPKVTTLTLTAHGLAGSPSDGLPPSQTLSGPWELRFGHRTGNAPVRHNMKELTSWHQSPDETIRYYSGAVTYSHSFEVSASRINNDLIATLSLNNVKEIAEVFLNGERIGFHWSPPTQLDITGKLKAGKNYLVVTVVNSINNWLIGDAKRPKAYREARSNIAKLPNAWSTPFAEGPLIEAGLLGPVVIQWWKKL